MTTQEPTRERVEAYEKALGCDQPPAGALAAGAYGLCYHHDEVRDDAGCPMAVAAARVEAERIAEVELAARAEALREFSQELHERAGNLKGPRKNEAWFCSDRALNRAAEIEAAS